MSGVLGSPVWADVATFLTAGLGSSGLVGGWWEPDPLDRSMAIQPLSEDFVKAAVTEFVRGTEWKPDPDGPPGQGFRDPGVTGRWLWLYRWQPFLRIDAFPGAFGLVRTSDSVQAYYWPDRTEVRRIVVRDHNTWSPRDRARLAGLVGELTGGQAGLPDNWRSREH